MDEKVTTRWISNMAFDADPNGISIVMDSRPEHGGNNSGPRPKPLLLASLGGCTGMDVVSVLQKMRVKITGLTVEVSGELTKDHPKHYHKIHIIYRASGPDLDLSLVKKAVQLSQDRYCGVSYMLGKTAEIGYEIILE